MHPQTSQFLCTLKDVEITWGSKKTLSIDRIEWPMRLRPLRRPKARPAHQRRDRGPVNKGTVQTAISRQLGAGAKGDS